MDMEIDTRAPAAASDVPAAATFKTTISKQKFYYFAVTLVATSTAAAPSIDARQFHDYLAMVLHQWLGTVGGSIPVDLLDYTYPQAVIRVPFDKHQAVWQAMTVGTFKLLSGGSARFQVTRGSAFSMGVACGSRDYDKL
ncbi:hypothetical protein GGF46_001851 [Coemansia sp. RSA 552]|nr:hypothetical protein GGF46_001851 [Coemansia sp. RSA 552]